MYKVRLAANAPWIELSEHKYAELSELDEDRHRTAGQERLDLICRLLNELCVPFGARLDAREAETKIDCLLNIYRNYLQIARWGLRVGREVCYAGWKGRIEWVFRDGQLLISSPQHGRGIIVNPAEVAV